MTLIALHNDTETVYVDKDSEAEKYWLGCGFSTEKPKVKAAPQPKQEIVEESKDVAETTQAKPRQKKI